MPRTPEQIARSEGYEAGRRNMPGVYSNEHYQRGFREGKKARLDWFARHTPPPPRALDGNLLRLGDYVRVRAGAFHTTGYISELSIRCFADDRMETDHRYDREKGEFVEDGQKPMQQVWVHLNNENVIYQPSDIVSVIRGNV